MRISDWSSDVCSSDLCLPAGVASGFMNNIAALALVMPVAIAVCQNAGQSPSMALMPLSYVTVLGGVTTLIGTPPNIIISGVRADKLGEGFRQLGRRSCRERVCTYV